MCTILTRRGVTWTAGTRFASLSHQNSKYSATEVRQQDARPRRRGIRTQTALGGSEVEVVDVPTQSVRPSHILLESRIRASDPALASLDLVNRKTFLPSPSCDAIRPPGGEGGEQPGAGHARMEVFSCCCLGFSCGDFLTKEIGGTDQRFTGGRGGGSFCRQRSDDRFVRGLDNMARRTRNEPHALCPSFHWVNCQRPDTHSRVHQ